MEDRPTKILRGVTPDDLIRELVDATDTPTIESILSLASELEMDIDINTRNEYADTVLTTNIQKGNVDIVEFLLSKGANVNQRVHRDKTTPLGYACECNNPAIVDILIKAGADVNKTDKNGYAPLHVACIIETGEDQSIIHMLVNAGAHINAVTKNKYTPLTLACKYSNPRCVLYLAKLPQILLFIPNTKHPIVALCMTISHVLQEGRNMSEFWLQKFFMLSNVLNGIPPIPITREVLEKAIEKIKKIESINNQRVEGMIPEVGMSTGLKDNFLAILEKRLENMAPAGGKRTRRKSSKRSKTRRKFSKRSKRRRNSSKRSKRRI
uniref:Uncharacterized protein n=1 Tax=viral metagenome TaxID=1070528 RepID=A0A6C0BB72_9ZZZZ